VGLRTLACWECGFESRQGRVSLNVVCYEVEVSATGKSLVQRSPTECVVSECDRKASIIRKPSTTEESCAMQRKDSRVITQVGYIAIRLRQSLLFTSVRYSSYRVAF
jgi:hypothetical protein